MSELFKEIEDEIKQEKFEKLWRSFGRVMVWASVGLVAATVVFVLWQNNAQSTAEAKTAQLLHGVDRLQIEDYKGAVPIFSALTDEDSSPYYAIAMLRKAGAQGLSGDKEGAEKTYAALAKHDDILADIAKLKGKIGDIAPNSPFYHTLLEYKAWQLLADGKKADAAEIFKNLANDEKTPKTIADRAGEVLRTIAPEKTNEKSDDKKSAN